MDYKNGKIYKITSDSTDKIYIGSTCQPLYKRFGEHKKRYKYFLNGKCGKTTSFELIALGDVIITLIEDYPCERKEQLHARERYHIESKKDICVNKYIPTRTQKEYQQTYYQENIDKIREQQKNYQETHKDNAKAYAKEYREVNRDSIRNKKHEIIICECGSSHIKQGKSQHQKSKIHLAFIQSQQ
jgi:hypothetical protein